VRWVSESKRPFQIVNDRGFQTLMKTRRPGYHISSAETVSRDVKRVFVRVCQRIVKMLQVHLAMVHIQWMSDLLVLGIRRCIELCH
jgi:hypothetical protein